jgi:DNA polymerase-3 subunit delta'
MHEWGHFVGAENKQFNIPVEEGRNIIQAISLKAYQSEYKIVLIWMPELMSIPTANAILKVLEEPPAKTLFLLVANDYEKLLATIISRCQVIRIRSFEEKEIIAYLVSKNLCDEKTASRIAKIADGNMERAVHISHEEQDDSHDIFANWMRLCFGRKYAELLSFCDDLSKKGRENQKNLLQYSLQIVRDALMNKLDLGQLVRQDDDEMKFVQNFSKVITEEYVQNLYEILNETYHHIERNGNAKIVFFDTSIKIGGLFRRN